MDTLNHTFNNTANSSRGALELEMGQIKRSKDQNAEKEPKAEPAMTFGLERNFTPFMALCFNFSSVGVLTALSQVVQFGLTTGGPVVMVWGWAAASFFNIVVAYSLAEMCSIFPGVGSVYYWTAMLCPWPQWAPVLSYIVGWLNLFACVQLDASLAQAVVQFL